MDNHTSPGISSSEARKSRISQRQPKACQECTRLKIRCDKQIPCGRCSRLSKACSREVVKISKAETIYRGELEFLTSTRDDLISSRNIDGALAAMQQRMALLTHGPDHQDREQVDALGIRPENIRIDATFSGPPTERRHPNIPSSDHDESFPETSEPLGNHFSSNSEGSQALNLQRIELLAWGRHGGNCFPHVDCPCRTVRAYSEISSINADPDWPGLCPMPPELPPRTPFLPNTDARKLVQFHMEHILWHHNVFNAPTFLAQCEEFWSTGTVIHPLWLSLYFGVVLVSAWTALNSSSLWCDEEVDPSLPLRLFRAMVQVLYRENFCENLSLFSVQAIVLSTRVAHNLDQSTLNATLVGAAIRIAHCMGLHKIESDGSKIRLEDPGSWFRSIETEVGRRCWNQLVIQDYFQIPFTDTYVIHPWQYTTSLPMNCHDDDMLELEDEKPTINSYPRTLSRIASLMPRLLDSLSDGTDSLSLTEVTRRVASSDQALRRIMSEIPSFLRLPPAGGGADSLAWLTAAHYSLLLSAADKIIMIHRPILYYSFQLPALARTRDTCVTAAMTIFRVYECISQERIVAMWTHSAFCVTAAMVIGLELLFRDSHVDDEARRLRAAMTATAQRLRNQKSDVIAERGAALIDTTLGVEEDLVIKLMRLSDSDVQSLKSAQRELVDNLIGENTIMAKFLALSSVIDGNSGIGVGDVNFDDWLSDTTRWFSNSELGLFTGFDMTGPSIS